MLVVQEFASHRSLLLKDSCTSVSLHKCVKGTLAKVVFCCLTPRGNPSESVQLGVRRSCQVTEKEKKTMWKTNCGSFSFRLGCTNVYHVILTISYLYLVNINHCSTQRKQSPSQISLFSWRSGTSERKCLEVNSRGKTRDCV